MESDAYFCQGCGDRLQASDDVRAVYRELADVVDSEKPVMPRWAYTHLGHEPQGTAYRIIGRGRLADLERERKQRQATT